MRVPSKPQWKILEFSISSLYNVGGRGRGTRGWTAGAWWALAVGPGVPGRWTEGRRGWLSRHRHPSGHVPASTSHGAAPARLAQSPHDPRRTSGAKDWGSHGNQAPAEPFSDFYWWIDCIMASGLAGGRPCLLSMLPPPGSPCSVWLCSTVGRRRGAGRCPGRGATQAVIQEYLLAGNIMKEKWVWDHLLVFPLNLVRFHFTKWLSNPIWTCL